MSVSGSPLNEIFEAFAGVRPLISTKTGYSSYFICSDIVNPTGLYLRFKTAYLPFSCLLMQYGINTKRKSPDITITPRCSPNDRANLPAGAGAGLCNNERSECTSQTPRRWVRLRALLAGWLLPPLTPSLTNRATFKTTPIPDSFPLPSPKPDLSG